MFAQLRIVSFKPFPNVELFSIFWPFIFTIVISSSSSPSSTWTFAKGSQPVGHWGIEGKPNYHFPSLTPFHCSTIALLYYCTIALTPFHYTTLYWPSIALHTSSMHCIILHCAAASLNFFLFVLVIWNSYLYFGRLVFFFGAYFLCLNFICVFL